MSRLKGLLRVASPSTRNTQQSPLHCCPPVAQHTQQPQQMGDCREFEALLNLVAPVFSTPAHEYIEIRQAALNDLPGALSSFRRMANKVEGNRK